MPGTTYSDIVNRVRLLEVGQFGSKAGGATGPQGPPGPPGPGSSQVWQFGVSAPGKLEPAPSTTPGLTTFAVNVDGMGGTASAGLSSTDSVTGNFANLSFGTSASSTTFAFSTDETATTGKYSTVQATAGILQLTSSDQLSLQSLKPFHYGGAQLLQSYTQTVDVTTGTIGTDELRGSPLAVRYDTEYTGTPANAVVGALTFTSFTNPWVTGGSTYGEMPEGPRGMFSLEGTTQWNQTNANSGSAPPLLNVWYTYKNKAGVAKNLGSNALTQLTPMFLADAANIGFFTIADVIAPNIRSEDYTTTFKGAWGWMSNPWFGTWNGGQLAASTAVYYNFISEAMFMGNVQFGTVHDFHARELWMANGLGSQSGTTPTVATHVGLYMQPFTAATTNLSMVVNNTIQAFDKDRTYTSSPFTGISGNTGFFQFVKKFILDYSNATLAAVFNWNPTVELKQTALSAGLVAPYTATGTYQNQSGSTAHLSGVSAFYNAPTFVSQGIAMNGGGHHTVQSYPVFKVTGGGTFTGFTTWTDYEADIDMQTGSHVEARYGWKFNDKSNTGGGAAGTITNQYALYIDTMVGGTNNYGIWNGSTTVWAPQTQVVSGATSQIGIVGSNTVLNNTSGGAVTLTSTPSVIASLADGQVAWIINTSANNVTIQDSTKLSGSGLKLFNRENVVLRQYTSLPVVWNNTLGQWCELGRPGIVPDGTVNVCTSGVGVTTLRSFAIATTWSLERVNGTMASPTKVLNTNDLATVAFAGATGTGPAPLGSGLITGTATEDWSGTAVGSKLTFWTTPNTTTTNTLAMTIDQDQSVTLTKLLAWSRSGTLTASQTFAQLTSSWTQATTASMSNVFVNYNPTQTWTVAPSAVVMDTVFNANGQYFNGSAAAINLTAVWSYVAQYQKTIDTQTGRNIGANIDFFSTPVFTVANSGTFTAGSWTGASLSPTINGASCTMSAWTHVNVASTLTAGTITTITGYKFADATGSGAVTNQFAIDIPAMTKAGTTNVGIRCTAPVVYPPTVVTITTNAGTVPVTCRHAKMTNSSAAGMTVTLAVTNALDGQELLCKIYDATAASQTVTFTNSETGGAGAPPATFGSTTIPTTYRFIFNGTTSKWTYCSR